MKRYSEIRPITACQIKGIRLTAVHNTIASLATDASASSLMTTDRRRGNKPHETRIPGTGARCNSDRNTAGTAETWSSSPRGPDRSLYRAAGETPSVYNCNWTARQKPSYEPLARIPSIVLTLSLS